MSDKNAMAIVVTGGNAGIGAAITQTLLDDGERVINISRREPAFAHDRLHNILADLADPGELDRIGMEVAALGATGLVHNAGVIRPAPFEAVADADLDYLVNLHLRAAIHLGQAMWPAMAAAGSGRIVLISSRGALGLQGRTVYAATKAGMVGMARTRALELAGRGVTVNVVSPGPVETDMFHELIPENSEHKRRVAASIPVGRIGRPEDVAAAVRFFWPRPRALSQVRIYSFVGAQASARFICNGGSKRFGRQEDVHRYWACRSRPRSS